MRTRTIISVVALSIVASLAACAGRAPVFARVTNAEWAARVRTEFLHTWRGYERYTWGHDELKPLSKTARDGCGVSLLMTPVDAQDTLILTGPRVR